MATIWRVQNDNGDGPYRGNYQTLKMLYDHNNIASHPSAWYDPLIKREPKNEERHGFKNMESLQSWFSKIEILMLKDYGFHVVTVVGEITAVGVRQVLFIPDPSIKPIVVDNI